MTPMEAKAAKLEAKARSIRRLPMWFSILTLALLAYALLNNVVAAGLIFDMLGALLLLLGELKPMSAQERDWSDQSTLDGRLFMDERKKLPYHKQFPLWVARQRGSEDIMDTSQEAFEDVLARRFWAICFLILGFFLQLLGSGNLLSAQWKIF